MAPPAMYLEYQGLFARKQSGRGVKFAIHLRPAPRLTLGASPPPPPVLTEWCLIKYRDNFHILNSFFEAA
jgi:hypothetical protein